MSPKAVIISIYTLPLIVLSILILFKSFKENGYNKRFIVAVFYFVILCASGLSIPISLETNFLFGLFFIILLYGFFIIAFIIKFNFKIKISDQFLGLWSLGLVVIIVISVPYSVLTSSKKTNFKSNSESYLEPLNTEKIQNKFSELINLVEVQKNNIGKAIAVIQEKIKLHNKEIEALQLSRNKLLGDIQHHKEVAKISEEQADAIIKHMNREKYKDNIFAFIIGCLSSATVAIGTIYFDKFISLLKTLFLIA